MWYTRKLLFFLVKKRFNCLKRQHQEDMTQFATMMLHLRMSIPVDLATVTLGSTTYSLKSKVFYAVFILVYVSIMQTSVYLSVS